jgi:hypothetical protein
MDFSSCPMMNIMSAHDIISNEEVLPTFARYDNDSIGNAQVACQGGELKNPRVVGVEGHDDAYIIKTHLENLQKQRFFLKSHCFTSFSF